MTKFDLWSDCPYWPNHRFKKNVCIGCGFKKPQLSNLINEVRKEKSTLEHRINRILLQRQEVADFDYIWSYHSTLADVYGCYKYSGYFGEKNLEIPPSAPLKGEKAKAKRRLAKVARLISFYEKNWPNVKRNLDDIFSTHAIEPYIRNQVETFLRCLMFYEDILTKNQIEELVAAYTYYLSELSERQVAEERGSLFPNITRKTLRGWLKFVKEFEKVDLG